MDAYDFEIEGNEWNGSDARWAEYNVKMNQEALEWIDKNTNLTPRGFLHSAIALMLNEF